jgi:predicted DCC family thiol-disulfide oxidoreductase YuxK
MKSLDVFYDGGCPLCRREIAYFRTLKSRIAISWLDLTDLHTDLPDNLDRCNALKRMHVRVDGNSYYQGAAAFAMLWSQFAYWRMLGLVLRVPPVTWCADRLYTVFLKVRPVLQRWVQKQEKP